VCRVSICIQLYPASCIVPLYLAASTGVAPRACVRVYARVLVPPNLYIHTYIQRDITKHYHYITYNIHTWQSRLQGPQGWSGGEGSFIYIYIINVPSHQPPASPSQHMHMFYPTARAPRSSLHDHAMQRDGLQGQQRLSLSETVSHTTLNARGDRDRFTTPPGPQRYHVPAAIAIDRR